MKFYYIPPMYRVKLIIACLFREKDLFEKFMSRSESIWGPIDHQSSFYPFDATSYYESEMGNELLRCIISYSELIDAADIAEIKIQCGILESEYSAHMKRRLNLDPGYLDLDKCILASMKYGRQKIMVGEGVYADPVLHFYDHAYRSFDWTFPDFRSDRYYEELYAVRHIYKKQLREYTEEGKDYGKNKF